MTNARRLSTANTVVTRMVCRLPPSSHIFLSGVPHQLRLIQWQITQNYLGIGTVKKVGALKIVHEKFRAKRTHEEHEQFKKSFDMAVATIPELKTHLNKAQEDMNPLKVLKLFQQISSEVRII